MAKRYRKKPVVIEAFQLNVDEIPAWFAKAVAIGKAKLTYGLSGITAEIETLEGWHHAHYCDYIIKGVKGEIYPCKPDVFTMTYEEDTDVH